MDIDEQLAIARGADAAAGYQALKRLLAASAESPAVYERFDELATMLDAGSSYERTRGFLLIAANARWDEAGRIEGALDRLARVLRDEKPTVVRQCVQAAPQLAAARIELADRVAAALKAVDPGAYRDSMQPLIARDVAEAQAAVRGQAAREPLEY